MTDITIKEGTYLFADTALFPEPFKVYVEKVCDNHVHIMAVIPDRERLRVIQGTMGKAQFLFRMVEYLPDEPTPAEWQGFAKLIFGELDGTMEDAEEAAPEVNPSGLNGRWIIGPHGTPIIMN